MSRYVIFALAFVLTLLGNPKLAHGDIVYVSIGGNINTYDSVSGNPINVPFISGVYYQPVNALALDGNGNLYAAPFGGSNELTQYNATTGAINYSNHLFIRNSTSLAVDNSGNLFANGEGPYGYNIGQYNASTGSAVNQNFITSTQLGGYSPQAIAEDSTNKYLYVATQAGIGKFNSTSGATINSSFISTSSLPYGLALSSNGTILYAVTINGVSEYSTITGQAINANFATGLSDGISIALDSSGNVLVADNSTGLIDEYSSSGTFLKSFNVGQGVLAIADAPSAAVPEPGIMILLGLSASLGFCVWLVNRRRKEAPAIVVC